MRMDFDNDHLASFVCSHISDDSEPILLVAHEEGDWQFLCGREHKGETPRVVGIGHLLERDPSLQRLRDLEDGWRRRGRILTARG
jgi:hypothetical protein